MIDYLRELNFVSVALRLLLSAVIGFSLGMERGRKRRPAGCRTYMLVWMGAALTLLLAPISYGPVQLRLSEAFTVLPMVLPQSIPGLFVGCLIANIFNPSPSIFDIVFGSLTTLLAAYGTYKLRNKPILAATCPVVANGLIVGTMVWALSHEFPLLIQIGLIALGEFGSVFVGMVLLTVLKSRVDFNKISKM